MDPRASKTPLCGVLGAAVILGGWEEKECVWGRGLMENHVYSIINRKYGVIVLKTLKIYKIYELMQSIKYVRSE